MRAQAASEFLVIIAVLSFIMAPFLLIVYSNASSSAEKIAISKATFSAARLASSANAVGSMGLGSRLHATVELPDVESISTSKNEVVINVRTGYGIVSIVQPSRFQLTSDGLEKIKTAGIYTLDVAGPAAFGSAEKVSITLR